MAVLVVISATGVVIWRGGRAGDSGARSDGSSRTDTTGNHFVAEPRPAETLRALPGTAATHVELESEPSGQDAALMFMGADGQQYLLGVSWNGGPPGYAALADALLRGGPSHEVSVGGTAAIQELCSGSIQRTVDGTTMGPAEATGTMDVTWLHDGWTLSLRLAITGANTDCVPDGQAATAVLREAAAVQFISQDQWDQLAAGVPGGSCPGYQPAFPGATLIRC